jgi:alkylation response protein AidB-like acyl-CoA dehydrogenase
MRDGSVIATFAASEPDAGSDVMLLRTRCVAVGDDYVLNRTKHFVTNAGLTDCFLIFATKEPRLNWWGVTAFLVPRDMDGLFLGPEQRLIGLAGCSMRTVHLDSATVPRSAMLGRLGQGSSVFRHAMLWEERSLSALSVGTMRRQVADVIDAALAHHRSAQAELATSRDLAGIDSTGLLTGSARTDDLFNAIGGTIYSGTSDIQRRIIAAEFRIVE